MHSIYIPQLLKAKERTKEIQLDETLPGLDTLTPVRGKMSVRHGGNFLEVKVMAETIITLTCDRCLKQYNHRLTLETSEIIWLDKNAHIPETYPQEREIVWEDLSESLAPDDDFEPDRWLYEQLSLALPFRKLCSKDCQQPVPPSLDNGSSIDGRWSALEILKQQLSMNNEQ